MAPKLKRKRDMNDTSGRHTDTHGTDTSKPSKLFQRTKPRKWSLSVAIPGSIVANAQSYQLQIALAGHIARACAVFCVDELVFYDDEPTKLLPHIPGPDKNEQKAHVKAEDEANLLPTQFLFHVTAYLGCPPYLRRYCFGEHVNLRGAGVTPSLDLPSHLRADEWAEFRDGFCVDQDPEDEERCIVDCGVNFLVSVDADVQPEQLITVRLPAKPPKSFTGQMKRDWRELPVNRSVEAEVIPSRDLVEKWGLYWGYDVCERSSLSDVIERANERWSGGYDFVMGTSERGGEMPTFGLPQDEKENETDEAQLQLQAEVAEAIEPDLYAKPEYKNRGTRWTRSKRAPSPQGGLPHPKHICLVFGALKGLEAVVAADPQLSKVAAEDVFDAWVNFVPGQGSRTIRTEEAVWIGLSNLWGRIGGNGMGGGRASG